MMVSVSDSARRFCRAGFAWIILAVFCALSPTASRATLIWDYDYGTQVPDSSFTFDSSTDPTLGGLYSEGLSFPLSFDGATYTSLSISTGGFVWLGSTTDLAQCCVTDTESDALFYFNTGPPRIAPAWYDLRPDLGGSIYFNGLTNEAVITFVNVPSDASGADLATFQVQLYSSGAIIFSYLQFGSNSLGPDPGELTGLESPLGSSPTAIDLSSVLAGNPVTTSAGGVYDYLQASSSFNLTGQSISFTPQANGGWLVATAATPEPATLIPAGGFLLLVAAIVTRQKRITKY